MQSISNIIRREREKRNLLLRQAAAKLDIDQALLSKIERKERKATKEQIEKFAHFYNLNKEELLIIWNSERVLELLEKENNINKILTKVLKRQ